MSPDLIARLLKTPGNAGQGRVIGCPDEHDLASFMTGEATGEARRRMVRHLSLCERCTAQLSLLSRLQDAPESPGVGERTLAKARGMVPRRADPKPSIMPRLAAAAVLVLALGLAIQLGPWATREPPGVAAPATPGPTTPQRQTRTLQPDALAPTVLSPAPSATVDPKRLLVDWTDVPGSRFYDVRLVDADGGLLWQQRVDRPGVSLPDQLELQPGAEYFVRVDAYPTAAQRISSHHVPFTVSEPE